MLAAARQRRARSCVGRLIATNRALCSDSVAFARKLERCVDQRLRNSVAIVLQAQQDRPDVFKLAGAVRMEQDSQYAEKR